MTRLAPYHTKKNSHGISSKAKGRTNEDSWIVSVQHMKNNWCFWILVILQGSGCQGKGGSTVPQLWNSWAHLKAVQACCSCHLLYFGWRTGAWKSGIAQRAFPTNTENPFALSNSSFTSMEHEQEIFWMRQTFVTPIWPSVRPTMTGSLLGAVTQERTNTEEGVKDCLSGRILCKLSLPSALLRWPPTAPHLMLIMF